MDLAAVDTTIRAITQEDWRPLWCWRNQTTAIEAQHAGPVDETTHRRWLATKLSDPTSHLAGIVEAGGVRGVVRIDELGSARGPVLSFYVDPAWRRRGLGAQLVAYAMGYAWQAGAIRLRAVIHAENRASQAVVQREGWQRVSTERDPWHDWITERLADGF